MPDFEITTTDLVKTIHRAEFAPTNLTERAFAGIQGDSLTFIGFDRGAQDAMAGWAGTEPTAHVHVGTTAAVTSAPRWAEKSAGELLGEIRDLKAAMVAHHDEKRATISLGGRRHGKSYFMGDWLARQSSRYETMWLDESAEIELPSWLKLDTSLRLMDAFTVTKDKFGWPTRAPAAVAPSPDRYLAWFTESVRTSDEPGIAAMAAKAVQSTPEPVLSLGGEQGTAAEFAQALQAIRAKNAPPVKETPRGLLTVAAMDHRLGRWNEA